MGTHCFFTDSKKPGGGEDACFNEMPQKLYDYYEKTNKVLKMKRIFVEEKETETDSEMADDSDVEDLEHLEHLRITKTYEEALNQFLKPGEKAPRKIVQHSQESDDDNAAEMDIDLNADESAVAAEESLLEELVEKDPSEDSETTNTLTQSKEEANAHEELERLDDPDYEPHRFS